MKQRWLWIIAGLAIGAGLLWYSVRSVSLGEVVQLLANANGFYLALALALSVAFIAIKTQRWVLLLQPMAPLHFSDLYAPVYAGTAANLLISHLGEIVRARMLGRTSALPIASTLTSIGLERLLDMLVMLLMLAYLFVAGGGYLTPALASAAQVAAGLSLLATSAIVLILLWPNRCGALLDKLTAIFPQPRSQWIRRQFAAAVDGFAVIGSPALVARALLASIAQWGAIAASIWCCMKAVGVTLDASGPLAVLVVLVLGLTLPTAPGYVGTTQVAFTIALGIFGVQQPTAFAGSVLYTACVVMPQFVVGTACLLTLFRPTLGKTVAPSA